MLWQDKFVNNKNYIAKLKKSKYKGTSTDKGMSISTLKKVIAVKQLI